MSLTDADIRNARPSETPQKLTDSNGLYLEVRPNGKKFWRYRYRLAGKENVFAIGEYTHRNDPNHISLADARAARDEARKLVKQGIHPAHNRKAELAVQLDSNLNTFRAIAQSWYSETKTRKGWTDYYAKQVETVMDADVYPFIGNLPIGFVTPGHIATILERVEGRGAATVAILCRQWCGAVFRYAIRKHLVNFDPTAAFLGQIQRPPTKHNQALPMKEIPAFLRKLSGYQGNPETVIAIRLLMLTLTRTKELREATWGEFDLEAAIWRIPAHRMKMRKEHIIPLPRQAVELLTELGRLTGGRELLFPNQRDPNRPMAGTSLNRALEYLGMAGKLSCHCFRSTASTHLNECGFRADVIEKALAHSEKDASRRPYNQALYLDERRTMLQAWADHLDALETGGRVIPLRRAE